MVVGRYEAFVCSLNHVFFFSEVECPEIELQYGRIEPADARTVGTTVKFNCNKDHILSGREEARCMLGANKKGYWSEDIPSCKSRFEENRMTEDQDPEI